MKIAAMVILAVALCTTGAWAGGVGSAVEVRIVNDQGKTLPTYPVRMRKGECKVYLEAVKGDHYRIAVRNRMNRRVGLVVAVDGRNIISGEKSWLRNSERMYILEPYASGEFSGWRTSRDQVHRFYFTDAPNSYAEAFGDGSAMGVIALAVYPEVKRHEQPTPRRWNAPSILGKEESAEPETANRAKSAPAASEGTPGEAKEQAARSAQKLDSAGTGYGRGEYSPSRVVAFEPERRATENIYVKYEWRATLCRLGVVACDSPDCSPPNRLWDEGGYAPAPPRFFRRGGA